MGCTILRSCDAESPGDPASGFGGARVGVLACEPVGAGLDETTCEGETVELGAVACPTGATVVEYKVFPSRLSFGFSPAGSRGYKTCCAEGEITLDNDGGVSAGSLEIGGCEFMIGCDDAPWVTIGAIAGAGVDSVTGNRVVCPVALDA